MGTEAHFNKILVIQIKHAVYRKQFIAENVILICN